MKNQIELTQKWFKIIMWLIAIHSFVVSIGLIFLPANIITLFGFEFHENNFFRAQGGVFHIVMVVVYIMAVNNINKSLDFVKLSIIAKLIGTVFLLSYFFIINPIITVLLSGVSDCLMAIIIYMFYRYFVNNKTQIIKT